MKNPNDAAKAKGWSLLASIPVQGDGVQASGHVTLCELPHNKVTPFVTHFFNAEDGGFHSGNYHREKDKAEQDFRLRSARYTAHHS